MATIEEKARVYSGLDQTLESNNLLDNSTRYMANCGFRDGAKWMLEKAADWIGDNVVFDKFGRPIDVENFIKAMGE